MIRRKTYTVCILAVAAILLTIGLMKGQYHDVLKKAVTVCLECVGIG